LTESPPHRKASSGVPFQPLLNVQISAIPSAETKKSVGPAVAAAAEPSQCGRHARLYTF
jgi:hypothetical protein